MAKGCLHTWETEPPYWYCKLPPLYRGEAWGPGFAMTVGGSCEQAPNIPTLCPRDVPMQKKKVQSEQGGVHSTRVSLWVRSFKVPPLV